MAKVLGVEQDTEARVPAVNPKEYNIRQPQNFDLISSTKGLVQGISDYAEAEADRSLGESIAKANERIQGISNPVERELAAQAAKNSLMRRFGAKAIPKINAGVAVRKLKQIANPDGSITTVDADTMQPIAQVAGPAGEPTTPEGVFQRRLEKNGPWLQANLPNFTDAASNIVETTGKTGGGISMGDVLNVETQAMDAVNIMKRSVETANAYRLDSRISTTAAEEARKNMARNVMNNIILGVQAMRNSTLANEVGRHGSMITPEQVQIMVQGYVTDVTKQMMELGAAESLGIDMMQFTKDLNEVAKVTGEYYKAVADKEPNRTKRLADVANNTVKLYTSEAILELRKQDPNAFRILSTHEGITAMTNALTAFHTIGSSASSLGPTGTGILMSLENVVLGAGATEAMFQTFKQTEVRTEADLAKVMTLAREILRQNPGPWIGPLKQEFSRIVEKAQQMELSASDKAKLNKILEQLDMKEKQISTALEKQGVSKEEQEESWKWLRTLSQRLKGGISNLLTDDRKRERPDGR